VNKDGTVDISDLRICARAFGSAAVDNPTTPWNETDLWNPIADVNGDNRVNIFDLRIIAKNYAP